MYLSLTQSAGEQNEFTLIRHPSDTLATRLSVSLHVLSPAHATATSKLLFGRFRTPKKVGVLSLQVINYG